MAEFVQQSIEEMVGELHEMRSTGLFDAPELRYKSENSAYNVCVLHELLMILSDMLNL